MRRVAAAAAAAWLLASCAGNEAGYLGSGTVEVREVTVSAQVGGTILELPAEEGSRVGAGDLLARIDDAKPRLELARAEARLEGARARLELLLAGAREEDVRQVREQATQARERLDLARKDAQRIRELAASGSATRSQLDQAEAQLATAQAGHNAAVAALDKALGPARPEEVQAAQAQVQEAQAAAGLARLRVEDTLVLAPVAGVVNEQIREVGELAVPGTPLLVLADPRSALLTVYVAEPLLPAVRLDGELLVVLDGRRDNPYRGTVTRIADQAEFTPSTVQTAEERARLVYAVTLRLDNRAEELKAGMPADVFLSRRAAK